MLRSASRALLPLAVCAGACLDPIDPGECSREPALWAELGTGTCAAGWSPLEDDDDLGLELVGPHGLPMYVMALRVGGLTPPDEGEPRWLTEIQVEAFVGGGLGWTLVAGYYGRPRFDDLGGGIWELLGIRVTADAYPDELYGRELRVTALVGGDDDGCRVEAVGRYGSVWAPASPGTSGPNDECRR